MRKHHIRLSNILQNDRYRLTATYLVIIMGLTLVFSSVIYAVSSSQFDKQLPAAVDPFVMNNRYYDVHNLLEERANEARIELVIWLVLLNIVTGIAGIFFSYFLARKTLEPIEQAMQAQAQFVSDASHELRTPLTALQLSNEVALRKKKLQLPEAKELLAYNVSETVKLRTLTDALLGFTKQQDESPLVREADVSTVLSSAIASFTPVAKAKHITIEYVPVPLKVTTNTQAVEQILRILLDNAVKYSSEHSAVVISVSKKRQQVVITVEDRGIGIAKRHQEKIFDRFYRVDSSRSSQHSNGSGLGLAIAKSLAEKNGFGLSVSSEEGKGSKFTIQIPQ